MARGGQCDNCSSLLEPLELSQRVCKLCGNESIVKFSKQLYFELSKFEGEIRKHLESSKENWRINAVNSTERYLNEGLKDRAISREYVTLEGKKISTSNNWAVWIPDIIERYNSDLIRYFFIANAPEKRDVDFSWREFINNNNGELLGAYGNLVNRTLVFVKKYFNNTIPNGIVNEEIRKKCRAVV
ncbi:class I tRNA ligase family protein [Clostridium tagluense]|uniref:class I tRNA ligase family protein n=1 Tax=Clostridium tagluense TaxID=360422 RepID=UPI00227A63FE|nr:class I tRNA ligase family protein [Clostridium tagluense]